MAFNDTYGTWLPAAPKPGIRVFATLSFVESFAKATTATAIPLQALDLFGDKQTVSFVYTAVGCFSLIFSFAIPFLIHLTARRYVYTLGALGIMGAAMAFMGYTQTGQVAGMITRVLAVACLTVTLNLYIMDHIRRDQFVRNDAARMTAAMAAWTIGPYLGVWLYEVYGHWAPFALTMVFATVLIAMFWYLRLSDNTAISPAKIPSPNPLKFIGRFVLQPRLRLAWLIAFARSAFWTTLFIYGPILMVLTGEGKESGGMIVSAANALMITDMLWARVAEHYGVRRVATFCFAGTGVFLLATGAVGEANPWLSAGLLMCATFCCVPIDTVARVPFYRSVRFHERAEMTSVYRTFLDAANLLPPLIYGILLGIFGLGSVFAALGVMLLIVSFVAWHYLPSRL